METCKSIVEFVEQTLRGSAEATEFASGAVNVDIRHGTRFVVVQYLPARGFGVSEIHGTDEGTDGHDAVFSSAENVVAHLRKLLME
jgi:hypothetical protein